MKKSLNTQYLRQYNDNIYFITSLYFYNDEVFNHFNKRINR